MVSQLELLGKSETILGPFPARRRWSTYPLWARGLTPLRSSKPGADVFLLWLLAWIDGLDVAASVTPRNLPESH